MKKCIWLLPVLCLLLTGCGAQDGQGSGPWPWILGAVGVLVLALAGLRTYYYISYRRRRERRGRQNPPFTLDRVTQILAAAGVILVLLALMIGFLSAPAAEQDTEQPQQPVLPTAGWETADDGSRIYRLEDGSIATGWQEISGKRYYFDEQGKTFSGWVERDGIRRYFRTDGSMARGKVVIDGQTRYFTSTGAEVVLVNQWNPVPEGYTVELVGLSNVYSTEGISVGKEMEADLLRMMDACNAASGGRCCVVSGYRDIDMQTAIYNDQVELLLAEGYSQTEAEAEAATRVALPGTSEHQMGLAVDINDTASWGISVNQEDLPAIQWLMANCHTYGFILRYPEGKTDVTGIIYEPWHYRYVGVALATELHDLGLTLEEYMESLN